MNVTLRGISRALLVTVGLSMVVMDAGAVYNSRTVCPRDPRRRRFHNFPCRGVSIGCEQRPSSETTRTRASLPAGAVGQPEWETPDVGRGARGASGVDASGGDHDHGADGGRMRGVLRHTHE